MNTGLKKDFPAVPQESYGVWVFDIYISIQEQLKYFVNMKLSTDSLWRDTTVILSGHHTPGEGEHKIMDYIRYQKSLPGYDPNTRQLDRY